MDGPSPRLSVIDAEQIMAGFPAEPEPAGGDDLRDAKPTAHLRNTEYDGWPLGGGIDRRGDRS